MKGCWKRKLVKKLIPSGSYLRAEGMTTQVYQVKDHEYGIDEIMYVFVSTKH